jgi:RNA polymerase sigma factor (sigma-70 family)
MSGRGLLARLLARRREGAGAGVPDSELLRRFTCARDEAAFELLVWRHGAMVLGLCQRTVRDEQLAEDAFQAVFLVLARKAGAVRGNLGGWLFKVARRVALRALKHRHTTQPVVETATESAHGSAERSELAAILDAEVARLPERLRRPVVLCYLGDYSTEDAARELGCPRGTVLSRLAAARKRLAERLTRRGVTLPAALGAAGLCGRLVSSATAAAPQFRTGSFAAGTASQLATGVLQTMSRVTLLTALGGIVLAATLVGGVGWISAPAGPKVVAAGEDRPAPAAPTPPAKPAADAPPARPDDAARKVADEKLLKLEKLADTVRVEIEAQEKMIELLAKANGRDENELAELQKRLAELEAELVRTTRERDKLEIETTVLKKHLADKDAAPPLDPRLIEQALAKEPKVESAIFDVSRAQQLLERALTGAADPDAPAIKDLKRGVELAEKRLGEVRKAAIPEILNALRASGDGETRKRLAQLEIETQIKKQVLEKLKEDRDALRALTAKSATGAANVAGLRKSVEPQQEMLAKLQREILLTRARRDGITFTEAAAGAADAKLDAILKELAALRQEVRALKERK